MSQPPKGYQKYVKASGRCPQCNSEVEITLSKQEIHEMYRKMRLPVQAANMLAEKENQRRASRNE